MRVSSKPTTQQRLREGFLDTDTQNMWELRGKQRMHADSGGTYDPYDPLSKKDKS